MNSLRREVQRWRAVPMAAKAMAGRARLAEHVKENPGTRSALWWRYDDPAELAGKQIDKMIDPSALADERDRRRRRLTKGRWSFERIESICRRRKGNDRPSSVATWKYCRIRAILSVWLSPRNLMTL